MSTKFLYPNPEQKEILDELEKISFVLSKPPSKELKKNMSFVRNFTISLFQTAHKEKKLPVKKQEIHTAPLMQKEEIKSLPQPKEELKQMAPPPPPPPSISVKKHPSSPTTTKLKKQGDLLKYESIEPEMNQKDWKIFSKVKLAIRQQLQKNPNALENENFINLEIQKAAKELKIKTTPEYNKKIKYYLNKNIKGFGKIDPLIKDPKVKSIIANSYDDIKVTYDNEQLKTNIKFNTNEAMENFIQNLAEKFNKKISEDSPSLEFSTDKYKININYNPLMGRSSFRIDKL